MITKAEMEQLREEIFSDPEKLAEALYEGLPYLQNLAESLARQHGKAQALSYYSLMGPHVQKFWSNIAKLMIHHSKQWDENQTCCCVLSEKGMEDLIMINEYMEVLLEDLKV